MAEEKKISPEIELLLDNARRKVEEKNFGAAMIWATQLHHVSDDSKVKEALTRILTAIVTGSCSRVIVSAFRTTNRGRFHKPDLVCLHQACELLVANDEKNASKRVLLAQAISLVQLIERESRHKIYTSASELDEYLDLLWSTLLRANTLVDASEAEVLEPTLRVELSAVALGNAKNMVKVMFAGALSDWDKARVVCEQVKAKLLPGLEIYHVRSATESIDTAVGALNDQAQRLARDSIAAAEKTMTGYTWKH